MSNEMFCPVCGTTAAPKSHTPGSILIEAFLWCCMIIPGLLYSLWRVSARRKVCKHCGNAHLIPAGSPRAQQLQQGARAR